MVKKVNTCSRQSLQQNLNLILFILISKIVQFILIHLYTVTKIYSIKKYRNKKMPKTENQ